MSTRRILARFGRQCIAAKDKRGIWRQRSPAIALLMVDGASLDMAQRCVDATERVAEHIRSRCLPPLSSSLLEGSGLWPGVH